MMSTTKVKDLLERNWLLIALRLGCVIGMFPFRVAERTPRALRKAGEDSYVKPKDKLQNQWKVEYDSGVFIWCFLNVIFDVAFCHIYYNGLRINWLLDILLTLPTAAYSSATAISLVNYSKYFKYFNTFSRISNQDILCPKMIVFDRTVTTLLCIIMITAFMMLFAIANYPNFAMAFVTLYGFLKFFMTVFFNILITRGSCVVLINEIRRIRLMVSNADPKGSVRELQKVSAHREKFLSQRRDFSYYECRGSIETNQTELSPTLLITLYDTSAFLV